MSTPSVIYSVKELTRHIKGLLESDSVLSEIWVQGEISNFVRHTRGHMYFTLKDEESRLRSVMFAGNNQFLKFLPKDGMKVIAKGYISLFERDGQYQFYIQEMQPDGLGNLYLAYEQLKQKLEAEGLFLNTNKKPIPSFPRCIGVITSPTGAAIRDILTTLFRRFPSVHVLLFPVLVQGEHAAVSIAKAIQIMNERMECDVLIIGRGGGSLEELWAFNEEVVARSIHRSHIPIISAVGHETDVTIADFVADLRAATPTAAAELAVPHVLEMKQHLSRLRDRLSHSVLTQVRDGQERLQRVQKSQIFRRPKQKLAHYLQQLDNLEDRLVHGVDKTVSTLRISLHQQERKLVTRNPEENLKYSNDKLRQADMRLKRSAQLLLKQQRQQWLQLTRQLDALSPLKVMDRGYSLVYGEMTEQGTNLPGPLIKSISQVQLGDVVHIRLKDGSLDCQVWGMEDTNHEKGS